MIFKESIINGAIESVISWMFSIKAYQDEITWQMINHYWKVLSTTSFHFGMISKQTW